MSTLRLFTWGYWGWGTAADRLIEAVDSVEVARGFALPVFVDIRLRRTGRAPTFVSDRFAQLLGADRYRWFEGLGNRAIADGGTMRIDRPQDARLLLNLAESASNSRRRVIFFCACHLPKRYPNECHRCEVSRLTLAEAKGRKLRAETVEWPGGEPELRMIELSRDAFTKVRQGAKSIPLGQSSAVAVWGAVPWYSVLTVRERSGKGVIAVRSGPAMYRDDRGGWHLPVFGEAVESNEADNLFRKSVRLFTEHGFTARTS